MAVATAQIFSCDKARITHVLARAHVFCKTTSRLHLDNLRLVIELASRLTLSPISQNMPQSTLGHTSRNWTMLRTYSPTCPTNLVEGQFHGLRPLLIQADWGRSLAFFGQPSCLLQKDVNQDTEQDLPYEGVTSSEECCKITYQHSAIVVQGCTKRWTPGSLNRKNCILLPAADKRAQLFHLIFTKPGVHL